MNVLRQKIPSLTLGIFAFTLLLLSKTIHFQSGKVERQLIAPPQNIERIAFGFHEMMADSLWIRAIQDFDFCDRPVHQTQCQGQSWLYRMLDAATNLSPRFRVIYLNGPLALSVIISDSEGASKLFDKAVRAFPNDWKILYGAAYQALYEEKNQKKAGDLLIRAGQNGAPPWVFSLAGRLYADSGNLELAESLLRSLREQGQDPSLIERMRQKIDSIKKSTH